MIKELLRVLLVALILVSSLACAAKRPVLYPNARLQEVGTVAAQQEIDDCLQQAAEGKLGASQAGKIARSTGLGAATGAAVGAAAGAVVGSAGRGAAMGAAGGGTGGFLRGLLNFKSRDLDPEQRRLVEQCLREKGYEVAGWK
ncbi:MAG: glycine zipper family protein [Thermodesulfobacteriota bacterium]